MPLLIYWPSQTWQTPEDLFMWNFFIDRLTALLIQLQIFAFNSKSFHSNPIPNQPHSNPIPNPNQSHSNPNQIQIHTAKKTFKSKSNSNSGKKFIIQFQFQFQIKQNSNQIQIKSKSNPIININCKSVVYRFIYTESNESAKVPFSESPLFINFNCWHIM